MNSNFFTEDMSLPTDRDWDFFQQTSPEDYLKKMQKSLESENRFFIDKRFIKLMYWFSQEATQYCSAEVIIPKYLYRARIYDEAKDIEERQNDTDSTSCCPNFMGYGKTGSYIPPRGIHVGNGRANPAGIVYLYAAGDFETAIAEVNPPLEANVSVATIAIKQDISILSFASLFASSTGNGDKRTLWKHNFILALTRLFNTPASGSDYLLCQYISELVKNIGFDGISFRSSKVKPDFSNAKGINYTIFNYSKCEAISSDLYYVANRSMELKKLDSKGLFHPLSTERGEDE